MGRASFIAALTAFVVGWMSLNCFALALGHRPPDPPPFAWLAGASSLASLYLVILILTTQIGDDRLTQRHELLNRGWASGALLLSEVVTNWGKHHLVVVVRTQSGDLILDNLTPEIKPWERASYSWVRIQMPGSPWDSLIKNQVLGAARSIG